MRVATRAVPSCVQRALLLLLLLVVTIEYVCAPRARVALLLAAARVAICYTAAAVVAAVV